MYRTFARTTLVVLVSFTVFFAAELAFEWWRLGAPTLESMSWADNNNGKIADLMSPLARAYNNILAMLIATIGLAIPLTANMHTPKLIEMFLRDRLNQVVLFFMAFSAANVLWVAYIVGPHFAPMWAVRFAVFGALFGWAVLIPYFFYVVRFLDPSSILARLQADVIGAVAAVRTGRLDADLGQRIVQERLHQVGTIVIKSLDRTDRGVALEGVWILKRLLDHYGEWKAAMPSRWFQVDRGDFVGLSREAIELVTEERLFFERTLLHQLFLAYQHAVTKASDVVSSISDANRLVALGAAQRNDEHALQLSIRYFNNFLRESIKLKHVHSIYDVFYQYRLLATALSHHGDVVRDIVRYLIEYAQLARAAGITFVPSFAVFDLAAIAIEARRADNPRASEIIDLVLSVPHFHGETTDALIVEAKLKLGAALEASDATKVRDHLATVPRPDLERCGADLLDAPRTFHEVTDRQIDLRWVAPEDREPLTRFLASLTD